LPRKSSIAGRRRRDVTMKDGRPYGVNYRHLCAEADVKNCFISGSRQRCAEYSSTDTKASTALGRRGAGRTPPSLPGEMVTACGAGLMPTEVRGNYLPEAPYLRETKTYLNCNSRTQCMGTSNMYDYQHNSLQR